MKKTFEQDLTGTKPAQWRLYAAFTPGDVVIHIIADVKGDGKTLWSCAEEIKQLSPYDQVNVWHHEPIGYEDFLAVPASTEMPGLAKLHRLLHDAQEMRPMKWWERWLWFLVGGR